ALTVEGRRDGPTEDNVVMGTPDYLAPEQAEDARRADARSDVYGLGCTLYYLLTGEAPYPAGTPLQKILAHREQPAPPVRRARPRVPAGLAGGGGGGGGGARRGGAHPGPAAGRAALVGRA